MPETPKQDRPSIAVSAVTAWHGDQATVYDPATLTVRKGVQRSFDGLPSNTPLWIDMDLECGSATRWLEPWHAPAAESVNWSEVSGLAARLGFHLPCCADANDPVATALDRLPTLNEMAVLRWLGRRLVGLGQRDYVAAPLVGCIPTCELEDARTDPRIELDTEETGPLELVLLRVNLLVIGRFMFTLRLPDRLCTGGSLLDSGTRRIPAGVRVPSDKRPNLTVFAHHLPHDGRPEAHELGDALALYLSATCWSAAEHGRTRLIQIERGAKPDGAKPADCDAALFEHLERSFRLGGALQVFEEELLRVQQRLSEAPAAAACLPADVRPRYQRALGELRAVEADIRTAVESLNTRLGQVQRERERTREQRQSRMEFLVVALGTLVIIPSLVVALFSDKVKFEAARQTMALFMIGSVIVGLAVVLLASKARLPKRRPRMRTAVAAATGVVALLLAAVAVIS